MGALGYPEFVLKPEPVWRTKRTDVMSNALVSTRRTRLSAAALTALPPVPWRDPHGVSPAELAAYIQQLEAGLPGQPAVGRSAHVPRHGARRQLRRLQVDGRARGRAGASIRRTSGRSSSTPSCTTGCGRSTRAEEETRRAADLAANPFQLAVARKQMKEIRDAAAHERPQRRVDQAADRAGARAFGDGRRCVRRYDVEMKWKFFVGACILVAGLLLKARRPARAGRARDRRRRVHHLEKTSGT